MNPGPVFDRVYASLKDQLMTGRWPPGAHLEPSAIGDDLAASITPVRDALHRLVGERLVEAPRNDGFCVASLTETQLRGLYGWQGDLLAWAIRRARRAPVLPAEVSSGALFAAAAQACASLELEFAIRSIAERLAPFRIAEAEVLKGVSEELESIAALLGQDDRTGLRRTFAAYHRRRQRAAPAILEARHGSLDPQAPR